MRAVETSSPAVSLGSAADGRVGRTPGGRPSQSPYCYLVLRGLRSTVAILASALSRASPERGQRDDCEGAGSGPDGRGRER